MMKDTHLVEAAIATDNCVVSLDATVKAMFAAAAASVAELMAIDWVNPDCDFQQAVEWLDDGAPANRFALGAE